jgi:hypothetical protein
MQPPSSGWKNKVRGDEAVSASGPGLAYPCTLKTDIADTSEVWYLCSELPSDTFQSKAM